MTKTLQEVLDALAKPFPEKQVKWRVGSTNQDKSRGMALAYIDSRDAMNRFDKVLDGLWQDRYEETQSGIIVCNIGVKLGGEWMWRADGAGKTDFEGDKGGMSDAFKRAAVKWGVGRYLYYLPAPWVETEPAGKSAKIKETPKLPHWATPDGWEERKEQE